VVLDPPRSGAGAAVLDRVMALRPRAIAYVACDPAALGRDVAHVRAAGWRVGSVRGLDLFPMTQHVEAVALLLPG
jgi:tRNA/tmRNA/rRNA uracil-C5-methylase (TrmA/RlmC/RlmD family)